MKRLYSILIILMLTAPFAVAQVTTERCFHLDKVQFLQQRQDFWRSHRMYSTSSREISGVTGGYYNLTELNYGFGLAEIDVPFSNHYFGVSTINGLRFANGLAIGGGVGYNQYNGGYTVPLFADIRYFIGQQRVKFFAAGDGGFYFNFKNFKEYSRVFANPSLGIMVPLSAQTRLSFSAGLLTMWDRDVLTKNGAGYRDSYINMKLGLLFGK